MWDVNAPTSRTETRRYMGTQDRAGGAKGGPPAAQTAKEDGGSPERQGPRAEAVRSRLRSSECCFEQRASGELSTTRRRVSGNATNVRFVDGGVTVMTPAIGKNGLRLAWLGEFGSTGRHGTCYLYGPKWAGWVDGSRAVASTRLPSSPRRSPLLTRYRGLC